MDKKYIEMMHDVTSIDMLSEIKNEISNVDQFLEDLSVSPKSLKPESQFALKRMKMFLNDAEKIHITLDTYKQRVRNIERISGIIQVNQLEEQISQCNNPIEMGRLTREMRHLKSSNSRKLSELVSNKQQLLQEQLRMTFIWKSILNYEIHILEESKNILIQKIITSANSSGSAEVIQMVRQRLSSLSIKDSIVPEAKVENNSIHIANIHVLQKTLTEQITNVTQIEKVISDKQAIVTILNAIANDIKEKVPSAPSEPVESVAPPAAAAKTPVATPATPSPKSSSTGMAYKGKK